MRPGPAIAWRPLRHLAVCRALGLGAIVGMLVLSTLPIGHIGPSVPHADKLQHAVAYLLLTGWYAQLVAGRHGRAGLALGLLVLGVLVEALQSLTSWRSAEIADLLANVTGIALGLLLTIGRGATLLERLERRFD